MAASVPTAGRTIAKVVCPHDCPDTCVMTVAVENGRAVEIGGDAEHPFTQGFLCAKVNRYLERVYSPDRILHPLRRIGRKGEGRFERDLLGRGPRRRRRWFPRREPSLRPGVDPAVLVRGQHGSALLRQPGQAFLLVAGREPARAHDLLERRRRRLQGDGRTHDRLRPRGRRPRAPDRGLGREHRQLQRAPVAVRRAGAPERRQAGRRSTPTGPAPPRSRTSTWPRCRGPTPR